MSTPNVLRFTWIAAAALGVFCAGFGTSQMPPDYRGPNDLVANSISADGYDWLQFGGNPQHDNFNRKEHILSPSNVSGLKQLWQVSLPDPSDSEAVYLSAAKTVAGVRDTVFLVTKKARLMAFDAHTGALIWQNSWSCCRDSESGPAVDPNRKFVYVYGTDGYIHKANVYDGSEVKGDGWPEVASPPQAEQGYSLAIATARNGVNYLYANSSQGIGHVTAINLADGSQHVFNFQNSDSTLHLNMPGGPPGHRGAAAWGRAAAVYSQDTDRVFFGTGTNSSTFAPVDHIWGGTLVALRPDGTSNRGDGYPVDSYTPSNWTEQFRRDQDLGSTDPLILPTLPGAKYPHLALQSGKDGKIRILNLDDLSGQGKPGQTGGELYIAGTPQGRLRVMTQPALWINPSDGSVWTIFTSDSGISASKVLVDASGNVSLQPMWQHATGVTTNQTVANGVVYYANNGGQSGSPTGTLFALDASTGEVLWSAPITSHHWASPIVANGVLYNPDGSSQGRLTAYGLTDQAPSMLLEAESLKMTSFTAGDVSHVAHDPNESGGHGVILEGKRPGDFVTLTVNVPRAGNYNVRIRMKNGSNRGIWQLNVDGVRWGSVDQFCDWSVFPEVDLGNFTFTAEGDHAFTFAVTGKNSKSTGYWVAIDYLEITPTSTLSDMPSRSIWQGVYTQQQSETGHELYDHDCASCHGTQLQGGQVGRALVGDAFRQNWYGQRLSELMGRIRTTMPLGNANLDPEQVAKVVAYLLERNGFPAGKRELASGSESVQQILIEPDVRKH